MMVATNNRRLKDDIEDAPPALPQLVDMRIRTYTVKASGEHRTGVIAQEMLWKHADMVHMGAEGLYGVEAPNVWLLVKGGRVGHCTFLLRLDYLSYRRLERRLGPCCGAQLDASIVEVEVDRPFGQAHDFCGLRRGLPTRHPGQRLDLAIIQHRQLWPYFIARDTGEPGINDGVEHVEIDWLDDVIVRSQASPLQLIFTIGLRGQENEWNVPELRLDLVQAFEHLKSRHYRHVDVTQHEVRPVLDNRGKTFGAAISDDRLEASISKLLDNQRSGFTVVFDAEDFLAWLHHPPSYPLRQPIVEGGDG
jgi:hypothetical protein